MDAVAAVGSARHDFVQEHHFALGLFDGHVPVVDFRQRFGELRQLVIVRGEHGAAAEFVMQVLSNGPGEGDAVVGAGAAADFVEDDERTVGGVVEDAGGFDHFDHESRLAFAQFVAGADASEHAVGEADSCAGGRDERTHLSHDSEERGLADVGRLTGHVGAGDDLDQTACRGVRGEG